MAYIDPATTSMFLSSIVATLVAGGMFFKIYYGKVRTWISELLVKIRVKK